jgi:hypothetical protein
VWGRGGEEVDQLRIESIIVSCAKPVEKNQYLHFAIAKEDANNDLLL